MIKKYYSILLIFFITASFSQNIIEKEKELIKKLVIESFDEVWISSNSKNMTTFFTEDYILLEDGEVWDIDFIKNNLDNNKPLNKGTKREHQFEFIDIEVLDTIAWVAYQDYGTWTNNGKVTKKMHWLESATAIKTINGWKLQMQHATLVRDKAKTKNTVSKKIILFGFGIAIISFLIGFLFQRLFNKILV